MTTVSAYSDAQLRRIQNVLNIETNMNVITTIRVYLIIVFLLHFETP
jgi:hypothetical protein